MASSGGHWKKGRFVGGAGSPSSVVFGPDVTYDQFEKGRDHNKPWVVGFYNPSTGALTLSKGLSAHDDLADALNGGPGKAASEMTDSNLHITIAYNINDRLSSVRMDLGQAGAGTNYERSVKNAYKALDKLKYRGFPAGTAAHITGVQDGWAKIIDTSL